jgi:hypothetical protein
VEGEGGGRGGGRRERERMEGRGRRRTVLGRRCSSRADAQNAENNTSVEK